MNKQLRTGIYPGTFDPFTYGHLDIARRALQVVDTLLIAVADNLPKGPLFSAAERAELVLSTLAVTDPELMPRIQVKAFDGLLVEFAEANHSKLIVRGLRAVSDFEYEFQMACMNSRLAPHIETLFIPASERMQFISSRFVKEIARLGGNLSEFVAPAIATKLQNFYTARK